MFKALFCWAVEELVMEKYEAILKYWFDDIDDSTVITKDSEYVKKWFKMNPKVDEEIRSQFSDDLTKAAYGKYDSWQQTPHGTVALIVLLDQFSRNIYRNSLKAFDNDIKALEVCLKAIKERKDNDLIYVHRQFVYLPLMHSENSEIQELSVQTYQRLLEDAKSEKHPCTEYLSYVYDFAVQHRDIIKRFQRFPHRNKVLKRKSTFEENAYLNQTGAGF